MKKKMSKPGMRRPGARAPTVRDVPANIQGPTLKTAKPPVAKPAATQPQAGQVERELGVPIPGVILPEDQWVRTAVKRLPPPGPLDLESMFGRAAPLIVDLGCGNGRFTLWSALTHPEWNHLAIDILPLVVRYATRRANQRGLGNVRVAVIGGRELLRDYLGPDTATEIHCYHPQPYYQQREHHLRLITPEFLALVHRSLVAGGRFVVQSDNPAYSNYIRRVLPAFFEVQELPGRWPEPAHGRTRREVIALREGLPIYRAVATRRDDLSEADIAEQLRTLPLPKFDADRRLARYDQLEREGDRPRPATGRTEGARRPPKKKKK